MEQEDSDAIYVIPPSPCKEKVQQKLPTLQRRATLPRRHRSCSEDESACYVNDGYEATEVTRHLTSCSSRDTRVVKSLSNIDGSDDAGRNILVRR